MNHATRLAAVLLGCLAASARAEDSGFKPIFDGKTLHGWDGDPRFWSVENGMLTGRTTKENPTQGNTFLIWRDGEVDDFDLRLEYKIMAHNSGVQYRSIEKPKEWGRWVVGGYQADIEAGDNFTGILYDERIRGILAQRGQKTVVEPGGKSKLIEQFADGKALQKEIKKEDWNQYRILAQGDRSQHFINDKLMADVTDHDPKNGRRAGILALQLHAGPPMLVQFRNVMLKRLKLTDQKKVVFIAGKPSHGWSEHEHNAGCRLLAKTIGQSGCGILPAVYYNGWPSDPTALDNADALVFFCDGGGGHFVIPHLDAVDALMKRGVGLACLHYGVEIPKGKPGDRFLDWIGGYFEAYWSVNPHWVGDFKTFPEQPICRGVKPFSINDEWYYHMRFPENMEGVTPILSAVPPDATRQRDWGGSHGGNPEVMKHRGEPEIVAWAKERKDGGRGFGFTGAHFHFNWADDNFRKLVLNAIVWVAHGEVPSDGVASKTPTRVELEDHLDKPKPKRK